MTNFEFTEVENLLLNLSCGLSLEDLTSEELSLLIKEFGEEWKTKLGYNE